MLQTQMEVKKVFSFVGENNIWDLTINEKIAQQHKGYFQASLEDLEDYACGGYIIKGLIETSEGKVVQWFEESKECEYGGIDEYSCGYKLVH